MKIALVCANGGHLTEMMELKEVYAGHEHFWVTYQGTDSQALGRTYFYRDHKSLFLKMAVQLLTAWYIVIRERPGLVITTGGAIAVPISIYCRVLGIHVIYMDCGTRVFERSGTGRFMVHLADVFLTQWPGMMQKYGKNARYWGGLF
ncbi:MAG: hypothetical protein A2054_07695 [Deltaproteobacteria bacterium GWA2_55_10]|nr:MAG: hypothetical protein A2054_07695 [Deltaproteobacteria bacterium GWA2_55_10]